MAYDLRSYSGKARATTLQSAMTGAVGSCVLVDTSTWLEYPNYSNELGTSGSFVLSIGYGTANEEKVLCNALNTSTNTVTISQRGYDGSTAVAHSIGEVVMPVFSAAEAYEANKVVKQTLGSITGASFGQLLVGNGTNSLGALSRGLDSSVLSVSSGSVGWSAAGAAGYHLESTGSGVAWRTSVPPSILAYQSANSPSALTANTFSAALLDSTTAPAFVTGLSSERPVLTTSGANKGRITINKAGVYQVSGAVSTGLAGYVTGDWAQAAVQVSLSGTTSRFAGPRTRAITGFFADGTVSSTFSFSVGDWIELNVQSNQAATIQGSAAPYCTYMAVTYIGPSS